MPSIIIVIAGRINPWRETHRRREKSIRRRTARLLLFRKSEGSIIAIDGRPERAVD